MKFSYIALFLVIALIAAFAYAEDGTKATATIKLETKLTDAELDTGSSYWSFDGLFVQNVHAAIAAWVPKYVFTAQYALNKKEVEVIIYYPPTKYEKPTDAVLDGLVEAINGDIPTTETNKVTGISIKSTSMDADCFDGDAVTEECNPILDGCTKDDECANFSICVFTCTKDEDCTEQDEVCIKEEGKTEGECGVPEPPAPVECTAENEAEVCADGEKCIIVGDATEGTCGVPDDDETPVECTAENEAEVCADGEKCIIVGDATEGTCGVPEPVEEDCTVDGCETGTCNEETKKCEEEEPVEDCTVDGCETGTCNEETKKCEEEPVEDCTVDGCETGTCNEETKKCEEEEPPSEFRALQNAKGKCSKREAKNSASATTVALTFAMTIAMAALMIA